MNLWYSKIPIIYPPWFTTNPDLPQTPIYHKPRFTTNPDLPQPRFTTNPNILPQTLIYHKPWFTTNPDLPQTPIYHKPQLPQLDLPRSFPVPPNIISYSDNTLSNNYYNNSQQGIKSINVINASVFRMITDVMNVIWDVTISLSERHDLTCWHR